MEAFAKTVVIHCGVSKTGTSSLQKHLDQHRSILAGAGIAYPARMVAKGRVDRLFQTFSDLRNDADGSSSIAAAKKRLAQLFERQDTVLISDETIFGQPFNQRLFYPLMGLSIERLNRVFEGYNVYIVVCLRQQSQVLNSYYSQYLRVGGSNSFDKYLQRWESVEMSWHGYLEKIVLGFRHQDSAVFHYDLIRDKPTAIQEACFGFAGCRNLYEGEPRLPRDFQNSNVSFKPHRYVLARKFNMIWNRLGLPKKSRMRRHIIEGIGRWSVVASEPANTRSQLLAIEALHRDENRIIREQFGKSVRDVFSKLSEGG